ncbi:MAG: response regulator, partial [Bryobacteraceae bacterium]
LCKDGSTIEGSAWTALLHDAAGAVTGIIAVVADITQRKQLEEQLRQSQKMDAVGKLAGGMAHDFNNLMTIVTGYSEMALKQLGRTHALTHPVEEVKKAGERAASLTRQLLAFSRRQLLQPRVVSLNKVVSEMRDMLQRLVGEDITLEASLDAGLWNVRLDPGQVEQVIMNLAANARDAMPRGGRLTISTQNLQLSAPVAAAGSTLSPGSYVVLTVSDTGIGMDARTQARIFEPFFTTKAIGQGTGLGLSTVYGIIQQSSGAISVFSEPGRGSVFCMYFPRTTEKSESASDFEALAPPASGHSERVLVVEDEPVLRTFLCELLESSGYRVLEARSGEEGRIIFQRHIDEIDLLLTDVVMPGMSGAELAAQLAVLRPGLKVLFMSGYMDDTAMRYGIHEDRVSFLHKPFGTDELLRKIRGVLDLTANPNVRT